MNITRNIEDLDKNKYFFVDYFLESSTTLHEAASVLAVGQSYGNPHVRNSWETNEMIENHCCKIIQNDKLQEKSGNVTIAFPKANINFEEDGVSQLLCQIMGGQLDIDIVKTCHVNKISNISDFFLGPQFGIESIRNFTKCYNKPLLGSIIKPKVGITPDQLLSMVQQLCQGGVNFIKEDECMASPTVCPLYVRAPLITHYLNTYYPKVIYAFCINGDGPNLYQRVKFISELGGNAIHVNFWCGFGSYKVIREMNLPLFLFFQKSGDKILTDKSHRFHISWNVICELVALMGVDFAHVGMLGGYLNEDEEEVKNNINTLTNLNVLPSLSCGFHAGLVDYVTNKIGCNYMVNSGGAIHGHPGGTIAGVRAFRQAIDKNHGSEYQQAINKWGYV